MVKIEQMLVSKSIQNSVTYSATNTRKYLVIHETANTSAGANAVMHGRLQANGNSRAASWNYTVDDSRIIQSFPDTASTWGAGSAYYNKNGINIEICVNRDGNYQKAVENTAALAKHLMKKHNIPLSNVVSHKHTSGWKNCPANLLNGTKGITWSQFKQMIRGGKVSASATGGSVKSSSGGSYSGSIIDYLHEQGIKSNLNNRKNLAVEYGTVSKEADYTGTAAQNTALLIAMMNNKPKQQGTRKEPIQSGYTGGSLVDYLSSIGVDNSFSNRKKLASQNGISNYTGTASQNTQLLNKLRGGGSTSSKSSGANLAVDGYLGPDVVKALQRHYGLVVDGELWGQYSGNQATKAFNQKAVKYGSGGSPVVKALQKTIGATADGIWGAGTTRALQKYLGTPVDGIVSRPSTMVKELQRRLNAGTF